MRRSERNCSGRVEDGTRPLRALRLSSSTNPSGSRYTQHRLVRWRSSLRGAVCLKMGPPLLFWTNQAPRTMGLRRVDLRLGRLLFTGGGQVSKGELFDRGDCERLILLNFSLGLKRDIDLDAVEDRRVRQVALHRLARCSRVAGSHRLDDLTDVAK